MVSKFQINLTCIYKVIGVIWQGVQCELKVLGDCLLFKIVNIYIDFDEMEMIQILCGLYFHSYRRHLTEWALWINCITSAIYKYFFLLLYVERFVGFSQIGLYILAGVVGEGFSFISNCLEALGFLSFQTVSGLRDFSHLKLSRVSGLRGFFHLKLSRDFGVSFIWNCLGSRGFFYFQLSRDFGDFFYSFKNGLGTPGFPFISNCLGTSGFPFIGKLSRGFGNYLLSELWDILIY